MIVVPAVSVALWKGGEGQELQEKLILQSLCARAGSMHLHQCCSTGLVGPGEQQVCDNT